MFLALGSNLEPRRLHIGAAIEHLKSLGKVEKTAPLYESEPYGEANQPRFLNTALILQAELPPGELLAAIKRIEKAVGRRPRYRWGPREIDIDIIFYNRQIIREADLQIPHPDYRNRRFVLRPLVDLAPQFIAPDTNKTLREALRECPDTSELRLFR